MILLFFSSFTHSYSLLPFSFSSFILLSVLLHFSILFFYILFSPFPSCRLLLISLCISSAIVCRSPPQSLAAARHFLFLSFLCLFLSLFLVFFIFHSLSGSKNVILGKKNLQQSNCDLREEGFA
ncbi:hypothetical protein Pfo_022225 [Paulownia fortunei]|nr:hypothetical protein Pfo_022225 [Paulownia fortunei]